MPIRVQLTGPHPPLPQRPFRCDTRRLEPAVPIGSSRHIDKKAINGPRTRTLPPAATAARTGDFGAAQINCSGTAFVLAVSTPASDPLVTGVGGTHLNANFNNGEYHSETVWNDSGNPAGLDFGAGGGGFSTLYQKPSYQDNANTTNTFRGVPDLTYNGDVLGGVLGVCSECDGGVPNFFIFGGTSSGSPQWAAITALADQAAGHRLGFLNPALYAIANGPHYQFAFHDITSGNNSWDVSGVSGYSAGPGWDPASGLGSPDAAHLISLLTS